MISRLLWLLITTAMLAIGQTPTATAQKKDSGDSLDAKQRAELAEWRAWKTDNWDEKKGMTKREAEWEAWRAANWNDKRDMTYTEAGLADQLELLYKQIRDLKAQVEKYKSTQNHKYKIVEESGGTWRFDEVTGDICLLLGTKSVLDDNKYSLCSKLEY